MKGFTLIELIVVIGIFITITTLILANYTGFSDRLSLKRTVQEIALSIRQAQSYGLAVREFGTGTNQFPGYGIYFQESVPDTYKFFADVNNNKIYDGDSSGELVQIYKIQTSSRIFDICGNRNTSPPGTCDVPTLNAVYLRPEPSVTLRTTAGISFSDVEIIIRSPKGLEKKIVLWISGQISVE